MLQCSAVSDDSGVGAGGADALVVDPVIEMEGAVPDNGSGDGGDVGEPSEVLLRDRAGVLCHIRIEADARHDDERVRAACSGLERADWRNSAIAYGLDHSRHGGCSVTVVRNARAHPRCSSPRSARPRCWRRQPSRLGEASLHSLPLGM